VHCLTKSGGEPIFGEAMQRKGQPVQRS